MDRVGVFLDEMTAMLNSCGVPVQVNVDRIEFTKSVVCKSCKKVIGRAGKTCYYKDGKATAQLKCECGAKRTFRN